MTKKFLDISKIRKKKGYQVRTGATPTCESCVLLEYDHKNPSQRMASVGVCRLDKTPALTFASCSKFDNGAEIVHAELSQSQEELAELMNSTACGIE
jgi:hypothetical protein